MTANSIKSKSSDYLLTIAIPAYNRSKYLDLCLAQICKQLPGNEPKPHSGLGEQSVELIVSDNNSTDNTEEIVKKYISQGHPIKYIKNKENIGADKNFIQCYKLATGKYVLIFGADKTFLDGALNKIIRILRGGEYGIVNLTSYNYTNGFARRPTRKRNRKYTVYSHKEDFARAISFGLGAISSNIVNKSLVDDSLYADIDDILDSHFYQFRWVLPALSNAAKNVRIEEFMFAGNTGIPRNSLLCDVWGVNFIQTANLFIKLGMDRKYFEFMKEFQLQLFFPYYILCHRADKKLHSFLDENHYEVLYPLYHNYFSFWFFTVPVIKLPLPLAKAWLIFTQIITTAKKRIKNVKLLYSNRIREYNI